MAGFWIAIQNADTINNYAGPKYDFRVLGTRALHSKHYERAVSHFSSALMDNPSDADLHYYIALALLRGRRPNRQSKQNLEDITRHLGEAASLPHAMVLYALVIEDYNLTWQQYTSIPAALVKLTRAVDGERRREILGHVPAPEARIWKELRRRG
jgi:hypothetical protein